MNIELSMLYSHRRYIKFKSLENIELIISKCANKLARRIKNGRVCNEFNKGNYRCIFNVHTCDCECISCERMKIGVTKVILY